MDEEDYVNEILLKFADKHNVKILAQNETYYTRKSDAKIQDIVACIKDGEKLSTPVGKGFGKRKGLNSEQFYLKNSEEVKQAFQMYPDAFMAYDEFLNKFESYKLKRDVLLPKFDIPEEFQDAEDLNDGGKRGEMNFLRHLTYEGARKKYEEITDEIRERLDFELDIIAKTGYPGYFLIVQDFCNEAKNMGVSVGPGRGSAAGSAVAYCIGITNVDPIKIPSSQLNKRVVESLVFAGAFDELDSYHRAQYFDVDTAGRTNIERLLRYSSSFQDSKNSVENSPVCRFAVMRFQIERPKINPAPEWQEYANVNREEEAIEHLWSKDIILERYLNSIEMGQGVFGVEAASKYYFGKSAKSLSKSEAAWIAAVLPNPKKYDPKNPSPFLQKKHRWIMKQMGYMTLN
ncbi:hypothetical protein FQR65_LT15283 [Abscondita terminalis]|nr:hypothetical protein FQR65_LT15283 [Abscondita terminalis]